MSTTFDNTDQRDNPSQAIEIHTYRYGDEIMREGEDCDHFFVILTGQVRISRRGKKIRILEDQDVFGLENVLHERTACYSARALAKSRIAAYGADALDHVIRESPRMIRSVLVSTVHQLTQTTQYLLNDYEAFALEDVRVNFYQDGDIIIEEGTTGNDFFRLVSTQGGLKVTIAGNEISRIEKPGEFFGEIAGLLNLPRQATVASLGDSVVEVYNADDLDMIIRDYPEIALQMMRTIVSRIVDVNRKLTGTFV